MPSKTSPTGRSSGSGVSLELVRPLRCTSIRLTLFSVKPDATDDEVRQVIDASASGTQIFSEAVLSSSYGEARSAYREVQSRQQDLAQMERTMAELAQLFNDVGFPGCSNPCTF